MYFREYRGFIQRRTMAGARNIEEVKELHTADGYSSTRHVNPDYDNVSVKRSFLKIRQIELGQNYFVI